MVLQPPTNFEFSFPESRDLPPYDDPALTQSVSQGGQDILTVSPSEAERRRRMGANVFLFIAGDYDIMDDISSDWHPDRPIALDALNALPDRLSAAAQTWAIGQINAHGIGPIPAD